MKQEIITQINDDCPSDQGVFLQPNGIDTKIKGLVIYSRYVSGGVSGGSCWGTKHYRFSRTQPSNHMQVLDNVLGVLAPKLTYLHYRKINDITHRVDTSDGGDYYGNVDEYVIDYVILAELETLLEELGYDLT